MDSYLPDPLWRFTTTLFLYSHIICWRSEQRIVNSPAKFAFEKYVFDWKEPSYDVHQMLQSLKDRIWNGRQVKIEDLFRNEINPNLHVTGHRVAFPRIRHDKKQYKIIRIFDQETDNITIYRQNFRTAAETKTTNLLLCTSQYNPHDRGRVPFPFDLTPKNWKQTLFPWQFYSKEVKKVYCKSIFSDKVLFKTIKLDEK